MLRKFDIGKVPKISPSNILMHENSKSDMKSQKNMNPNYQEKKILFLPPKHKKETK